MSLSTLDLCNGNDTSYFGFCLFKTPLPFSSDYVHLAWLLQKEPQVCEPHVLCLPVQRFRKTNKKNRSKPIISCS